jgi:hypothetical protein
VPDAKTFTDWLSVAANVFTVGVPFTVLLLWISGRNPLVRSALARDRRRTVGKVLASLADGPVVTERLRARRSCGERVRAVLADTTCLTPAEELRWLDQRGADSDHPLSALGAGPDPAESLRDLADAYRRLGARQRARGLLGGGSAPLIAMQADTADAVATHLGEAAAFMRGGAPTMGALSVLCEAGTSRLELSHLAPGAGPGGLLNALSVSHVRERWVVAGGLSEALAEEDGTPTRTVELTPSQRRVLDDRMIGKAFDGVLPSLRAMRVQRDGMSGWLRLHLTLAEASYSAVVATQYVGSRGLGTPRAELSAQAAVLTLSCLPVTSDGYLVLARRSEHVPFPHRLNPGVNGNLEMRPRFGIGHDNDPLGLPDPLRALAREACEELALEVTPSDIQVSGTCRFDTDDEVGTTVLLSSCRTGLTAHEVAVRAGRADPAEGLWEVDDTIVFVPAPPTTTSTELHPLLVETLRWTLNAADHQPHLTSCLLAHHSAQLHDHFRRPGEPGARRLTVEEARPRVEAFLHSLVTSGPVPPPEGTILLKRGTGEAVEVPAQP